MYPDTFKTLFLKREWWFGIYLRDKNPRLLPISQILGKVPKYWKMVPKFGILPNIWDVSENFRKFVQLPLDMVSVERVETWKVCWHKCCLLQGQSRTFTVVPIRVLSSCSVMFSTSDRGNQHDGKHGTESSPQLDLQSPAETSASFSQGWLLCWVRFWNMQSAAAYKSINSLHSTEWASQYHEQSRVVQTRISFTVIISWNLCWFKRFHSFQEKDNSSK